MPRNDVQDFRKELTVTSRQDFVMSIDANACTPRHDQARQVSQDFIIRENATLLPVDKVIVCMIW